MAIAFQPRSFGSTGIVAMPLGLSASYFPGKKAIHLAADEGVNFFFAFGVDFQMIHALRELLPSRRDKIVLVTGAYNYVWAAQSIRKTFEKRLRQFKAIGLSCHNREFLGKLAANGDVNTLMLRYNAAHRGAERDIFPFLTVHNPGVISYTATRWTYLLRRPKSLPKDTRIPTAAECYRFVLSNPNVHVVLTAPKNERELRENLEAIRSGPLDEDDMTFMCQFGDAVHNQQKWFM